MLRERQRKKRYRDREGDGEKGTKINMLVKEEQNSKSKGKYIGSERVCFPPPWQTYTII